MYSVIILVRFLVDRLIYTARPPSSSSTARVIQPSCLPNLTRRSKNHECANVPRWFSFIASQATCLLCPRLSVSPRPLAHFHSSLHPILSNFSHSVCLSVSRCLDAEVHFVNMTAFTRGGLHSSFWIVDRRHIYIGSADMDWRSLSKVTTNIDNMSVQSTNQTRG